ncbi:MAG: methylcobamide--CoM methyltransferase, partial [Synergistaceae bacterium]|nr:methylcobamide--CoM methyltransferase [Synergistaceae bacterium]
MNEKKRILKTLAREKTDRPPVICPGGMMNSAVTQTLTNIGGCHNADAESMLQAALNVRRLVGFEN